MNERSMHALEYYRIKEMLLERTVSESGRMLAAKQGPSADARRVRALLTETEEALRLLESGASVPLSAMEGIEPFFALLGKGAIFSETDLSHLSAWLSAVAQMKRYMAAKSNVAPVISGYADSLHDCPELRSELERCLRYGKLTDHASPELAKIRRQMAAQEEGIRRRLEQASGKYKAYLQDSNVSKRAGHFVLSVRRECRKSVPGTVWDESASGQTLFVEPTDVAALQAEWELWKADEGREETRILAGLSDMAEQEAPSLRLNLEAMATFDYIFARGKLAQAIGGRPAGLSDQPLIRLRGARHPLLGRDAVPLNVEIGGDFRQLMITGPNTGGKTVALKTIGLSALMIQSGLLVPADAESRFGVFSHILADVGDGQSIAQSLSTFSAHISAVTEMLRTADERSLLLLDELAAGTDPGEGIALSLAILEELLTRGSLVAATTHFNEIKRFAARTPGCRNARMAFDGDTLQPLYRLEMDEAGDSNALAIARKYGLPERVVKRAEERLAARAMNSKMDGADNEEDSGPIGSSGNERLLSPYVGAGGKHAAGVRHERGGASAAGGAGSGAHATGGAAERRVAAADRDARGTGTAGETFADGTEKRNNAGEAPDKLPGRPLQVGDSVWVHPLKRTGIVFRPANERGDVVVQITKRKLTFNQKRLSLHIPREELYPGSDYDLDIVFESVADRKARKLMSRKHAEGVKIVKPPEEWD